MRITFYYEKWKLFSLHGHRFFSPFKCSQSSHCLTSSNCTDGYLKIYLRGQETMDAYDKYDHELCGTEKPLPVVSDGPRLVMVFSSGELQGRGFKVEFHTKKVNNSLKNYKLTGTILL